MAALKLGCIQMEALDGLCAFVVVPGIGEQNSADVPKDSANSRQEILRRELMKECKAIQQLGNSSSFISGITRVVKATPPPAWSIGMFELEEIRLFDLCL